MELIIFSRLFKVNIFVIIELLVADLLFVILFILKTYTYVI